MPPRVKSDSTPPHVKLYYNDECCRHTSPWPHQEKSTRASSAFMHLQKCGLASKVQVLPGRAATDNELRTVHTTAHIDEVRRMTAAAKADPTNRELREPDGPGGVYYSEAADSSARLACGCVIDAASAVLRDSQKARARAPPAFAIVRPPGHHAGADDTEGHCAEVRASARPPSLVPASLLSRQ
jgi:histone deacetylase 4/5